MQSGCLDSRKRAEEGAQARSAGQQGPPAVAFLEDYSLICIFTI